jgi:putative heme iron utilization protein
MQARSASLSTHSREPLGYPYGSLVAIAFDGDGAPLMLVSNLAEHAQYLAARSEASILVAEALDERGDALALGRVTLIGPCHRITGSLDTVRATFLAANPNASHYVDFDDFAFYRLEPVALRYIGGFGRMSWVTAEDYRKASPDPLANAARGILAHMNEDHADALIAIARAFGNVKDASRATMTAVDRYGFEIVAVTPEGPRAKRIAFDGSIESQNAVRQALVAMVGAARNKLSAS